jgi:tetratricopeptide (TPR) repeat protein
MKSFAILLSALLATLACSTPVRAQTARERAAALGEEATAAFDDGRVDDAIAAYTEAFELVADPSFAYNLGGLYMMTEELAQAHRYFTAYLELFPGAADRADVETLLQELQAELTVAWTRLTVTSAPDGAVVSVVSESGTAQQLGVTPVETWVRPGLMTVELSLDGYEPASDRFNGVAGVLVPLEFSLTALPVVVVEAEPEPEPEVIPEPAPVVPVQPPAAEPGTNLAGWVVAGTGLAVAGTGVAFVFMGQGTANDHNDLAARIGTTPVTRTELDDLESQARNQAMVGGVLTGVGAAALLTGVVMLVRGGDTDDARTSVVMMPTRSGAQILLSGRF